MGAVVTDKQYRRSAMGYQPQQSRWLLHNTPLQGQIEPMKQILLSTLAVMVLSGAAQAACYADYKAKRDGPLRLHYGVVAIPGPCTAADAATYLTPLLGADGWQLLNVLSVFDDTGLAERRDSAGTFFLRY